MKLKNIAPLILAISMLFLGCELIENESAPEGEGRLVVRLTDAPFPHDLVSEANITITKIEIREKRSGKDDDESDYDEEYDDDEYDEGEHDDNEDEGEDEDDDEDEDEDEDDEDDDDDKMGDDDGGSPYITISEETIELNLLDLVNGLTMTLVDTEIPAGEYDQIRLYVSSANVVLENGEVFDLKIPSGKQSGLKVFIKPGLNVVGGLTSELLLDFDVCRSFVFRGNIRNGDIKGVIFKPVIKAVNLSSAGTLTGLVYTTAMGTEVDPVRINSGGPEYTTEDGKIFIADEYFTGGNTFDTSEPIDETMDDPLYQTERFGEFSYEIPVESAGTYNIVFHFAEIFFGVGSNEGGPGSRVFNVTVEGNPALTDFDILMETNPSTALSRTINDVEVNDGFASIEFISQVQNPKVSAIELIPVDTGSDEDQIGLEGATVSVIVADTVNTSTLTDASGMYTVMGLLEGEYDVMVELEGYQAQTVNGVRIDAGNQTVQDFELEPEP